MYGDELWHWHVTNIDLNVYNNKKILDKLISRLPIDLKIIKEGESWFDDSSYLYA